MNSESGESALSKRVGGSLIALVLMGGVGWFCYDSYQAYITKHSDQPTSRTSESQPPTPSNAVEPRYVLQDGQYYGYELTTGEVVMFAFLGYRDGIWQVREKGTDYSVPVYECADPCEFMKIYNVYPKGSGDIIDTRRMRVRADMPAFIVMRDAASGHLEPMTVKGNQRLWVDSDGPTTYPVDTE